jgi:ABC-type sugar transport system permease subunit
VNAAGSAGIREGRAYALRLAPTLLALTLLVAVPLVYLVYTSLLEWKLTDPLGKSFVGAANYVWMLRDGDFWHAVRVTAIFIVGSVSLQLAIGLTLVEALASVRRGAAAIRTVLILPMVIPPLVVGLI